MFDEMVFCDFTLVLISIDFQNESFNRKPNRSPHSQKKVHINKNHYLTWYEQGTKKRCTHKIESQ